MFLKLLQGLLLSAQAVLLHQHHGEAAFLCTLRNKGRWHTHTHTHKGRWHHITHTHTYTHTHTHTHQVSGLAESVRYLDRKEMSIPDYCIAFKEG